MEQVNIVTFNCHGFASSKEELKLLCENNQILCIQEHWLFPEDVSLLDTVHDDFKSTGVSAIDPSKGMVVGRPYGGVGVLWHKKYDPVVKVVHTRHNFICGIKLKISGGEIYVFCVYLPYESYENIDEYVQCLAILHDLINECDSNMIYILGDFNCDINKHSIYGSHLDNFINEAELVASDYIFLKNAYTFVSAAWGTTSWLDHCLSSEDGHGKISNVCTLNDYVSSDHLPICIHLNLEVLPELYVPVIDSVNCISKPNWDKVGENRLNLYSSKCNEILSKIDVKCIQSCKNCHCKNTSHIDCINNLYSCIVDCLSSVSNSVLNNSEDKCQAKFVPGWCEYVKDAHQAARDAFLIWQGAGKPRQGPVFEIMKRSRSVFKYSLRFSRRNEGQIKAGCLAKKILSNNSVSFWKEVKAQQQRKIPMANVINEAQGTSEILNMWSIHYKNVFQKCNLSGDSVMHIDKNVSKVDLNNDLFVSVTEIIYTISDLPNGKSTGIDNLSSEHLKHAGDMLPHLLSILFTSMFMHGYMPPEMIKSVTVPIVKSKMKSISDKSNYRPVTLATIISKLFEKIIFTRIEMFLLTADNQYGFKPGYGPDMCIFAFKEVVSYYVKHGSNIFVTFLDASMAFDNLNHCKLFEKLMQRNIPLYILRILWYWYRNQMVCIRWNNKYSQYFNVNNGVRQGGLLSPLFYNVYVNDLSIKLNNISAGCYINGTLVNHFMYADDVVLLAPSVKGLQKLVNECTKYGDKFDITFNRLKSNSMIVSDRKLKPADFPCIYMNKELLEYVNKAKYLGHVIHCTLSDSDDIERQTKSLYVKANVISRKFKLCNDYVKSQLFRTYCTNMYCCNVWGKYTATAIKKIQTAYNNSFRMIMQLPKFCSASEMFTFSNVPGFNAVLRRQRFSLLNRLGSSNNRILNSILSCDWRFESPLLRVIHSSLYRH